MGHNKGEMMIKRNPKYDWTIRDGRLWLLENRDAGVPCPCCDQFVKAYHRKISNAMAHKLLGHYKKCGLRWGHWTTGGSNNGDLAKLRFWGLVEKQGLKTEDGNDVGKWRVTKKGENFIHGRVTIPQFIWIYNNEFYGSDGSEIYFRDCFKEPFHYDEMMRGL
jgi:hypothetical protein